MTETRWAAMACACALAIACGAKTPAPKPAPKRETEQEEEEESHVAPPPKVDAGEATSADAQATTAPAPSGREMALCALPSDPTKAQCLSWHGCAGGILETYAGAPIRKCAASADACDAAEQKLVAESDKLRGSGAGSTTRTCKLRNYLRKEIRIDGAAVMVCPEDADDRPLSEIWKQLQATCKELVSP